MSDKRTDHKAEALESDNLTPEQWVTFAFETSDASNIYMAIRELKHATLYAAEQARIANLIALNAPYQEMDGAMYSIGERMSGSDQWSEVVAALKIGDPE